MKKIYELDYPKSTLNKAGEKEELFILRGRDSSSPKIVLQWIIENLHCSDHKLREAFEIALSMNRGKNRKPAD